MMYHIFPTLMIGCALLAMGGIIYSFEFYNKFAKAAQIVTWLGTLALGCSITLLGFGVDPLQLLSLSYWLGGHTPNELARLTAGLALTVCVPAVIAFIIARLSNEFDTTETTVVIRLHKR